MGQTSAEIQAQIDSKNVAIEQEAANGQQTNHEAIIQWRAEIVILDAEKVTALAEEATQQQAAQAQVAQISGLKETLITIFEATFPKEETVPIIGLTEYESAQQTYNQLTDQAVDEDQNAVYAAFNEQLAQKDETIRQLKQDALETNQKLNEAGTKIADLTDANTMLDAESKESKTEKDALTTQLQQQSAQIIDLQKQLNNATAKAPQIIDITPTAPSESLSDRIAQAKANSKLQLANVKAISANWVEGTNPITGQTQVAHVNDVQEVEIPAVLPQIPEEPAAVTTPQTDVPAAISSLDEHEAISQDLGETKEVAVITLESLQAQIDKINAHVGLVAA